MLLGHLARAEHRLEIRDMLGDRSAPVLLEGICDADAPQLCGAEDLRSLHLGGTAVTDPEGDRATLPPDEELNPPPSAPAEDLLAGRGVSSRPARLIDVHD
ncbi:MAG: hypothetical protein L0323_16410 [Planctomycetes bacterium]|nr:hypothetical protein [Planctomycetota bacterium]